MLKNEHQAVSQGVQRFDKRSGRPAWVVYADARGADLAIDINDGRYTFMFLKLAR